MRYLVVRGERPVRVTKEGLMFFASPWRPANLFSSYEQARTAIRLSQGKEKQRGWDINGYRVQSVSDD